MRRSAIRKIQLSGLTGISEVVGAGFAPPVNVDIDSVACIGDEFFTEIPRPTKHHGDLVLTLKGTDYDSAKALAGTVVDYTMSAEFWDGDENTSTTITSGAFVVGNVSPSTVNVNGSMDATVDLTIRKTPDKAQ